MCPTCKKDEYSFSSVKGFSKDVLNECIRCNTIWIDRDGKAEVIYVNSDKS